MCVGESEMTSFRNIVIGTNLATVGLGVLLVLIIPPESAFAVIGKILVITGIFADIYLAFSLSSGPVGRRSM
jgi:hypothetical protein